MGVTVQSTDVAWWADRPQDRPPRLFEGSVRSGEYVTTRDGTRIAVDVHLPRDLPPGTRVPTVMSPTPYLRSIEFRTKAFERLAGKLGVVGNSAEFADEITAYGYAYVVMELRGAGASFGQKKSNGMPDAVSDGADVIDWIVSQPWSNGNVGATGISGPGMLSQWLTTAKHPALKAIAPRFTSFDIFASTHPGGLIPQRFLVDIGALLAAMDNNRLHKMVESPVAGALLRLMIKGVQPVDVDHDRSLLAAAVAGHADNEHFDEDLMGVTYRDEPMPGAADGATVEAQSPFVYATDMEASNTAVYAWAGWYDAAFCRDMLSLHNTIRTPGSRIVIGPWSHGGRWHSSPVAGKKQATDFDHVAEMVRFFDAHLRDGATTGVWGEEPIHYFTMGEERWKSAPTWPIPSTPTSFHFGEGSTLTSAAPATGDGADRYAVDFTARTGVFSRFGKHMTGGRSAVRYPDRAARDQQLLCYTSPPLEHDMEVTGHPVANLFVTSSATDGAFLVYLEDVAPDGEVLNVTDGCLRASARATAEAPYWLPADFHPFRQAEARPLVPGEVTQLSFDLYPVSWLFRAGHRVRVAIAGADVDNFAPVAKEEAPVITVHRTATHPSGVELPVVS